MKCITNVNDGGSELIIQGEQFSETVSNCLIPKSEISVPNKSITTIKKGERFTKISIKKDLIGVNLLGKQTQTFTHTDIIKDNLLDHKETHIKKVFVSQKEKNTQDVIVREIIVDHLSGNKKVQDRKLSFSMNSKLSVSDILGDIIGEQGINSLENAKNFLLD